MEKTYNTKLTAEQKADLKSWLGEYSGILTVVFIRNTTIALIDNGEGGYYIGKAVASKRERKLRVKVGMYYAINRARNTVKLVYGNVYDQIIAESRHYATAERYCKDVDIFKAVRYL